MKLSHPRRIDYSWRYLLWGSAVPLLLSLIEWPFRAILTPSNILMMYLLGVVFVAIRFGLWSSILASLTSAGSFAFLFAPPIFSFAIDDPENLGGLIVMLLVGTVTSNLADNVRYQALVAESREKRTSALYRLTKELAEARLESEIIDIGKRHIHDEFGGRNTFLFPDENGQLVYPGRPSSPVSLYGADLAEAQKVLNEGRTALPGQGKAYLPLNSSALAQSYIVSALPEQGTAYLPLNGSSGPIGVLALVLADLRRLGLPEQRQLLDSFLMLIVHALERARLAEQVKDTTLRMQAETLRNSLLSSISHDLRTPLATIIGAASTLATDEDRLSPDNRRKLVAAISEEAQRMSDLTTKILEMARLEAGEVRLNRQWYAPEEIVGSALRRLAKKLKDRQVNTHMADNLVLAHVDAVLLQQVMVNLLDNADKYSPAGTPIDIYVEAIPQGLSMSVADRGAGIPAPLRQKVFDKFFRIHAESAQSGVGLGLSICRAIVEAHGGIIRALSRNGGGTIFQLSIPMLERPPTINSEEKD
ncbi:MAG: DUF4118 domain-containing protein [Methylobacter sp.]